MAYIKDKGFYIVNINNILWQLVIKKPPELYKFDLLDETGNKIGETQQVLSNKVYTESFEDLTYEDDVFDNTKISNNQMSFDETIESNSLDNGRKYILYIRKATNAETLFFKSFKKGRVTQIISNEITNRISDWYPLNIRHQLSNNKYQYGTLFNTDLVEVVEDTTGESVYIDPCNLCRPVANTSETLTTKQRYSNAVKINFRLASRTRTTLC